MLHKLRLRYVKTILSARCQDHFFLETHEKILEKLCLRYGKNFFFLFLFLETHKKIFEKLRLRAVKTLFFFKEIN